MLETLSNLAKAIRDNPWFLSIVLLVYADGYFINLYMLPNASPGILVFPELASGAIWICLVATLVVAAARDYLPFNVEAVKYLLITCIVVASATLGIFLIMITVKHALTDIAKEAQEIYGKDYRLIPAVCTTILGLGLFIPFSVVATRAARSAIGSVSP